MNRIESIVFECDWEPHGSARRWRVASTFHAPSYQWPLPTMYFPTRALAERYAKL
jgi:hypothetical protein